jgi:hypothetical protein
MDGWTFSASKYRLPSEAVYEYVVASIDVGWKNCRFESTLGRLRSTTTRWGDRARTLARATPVALRAPSIALALLQVGFVTNVMALLDVTDVMALDN